MIFLLTFFSTYYNYVKYQHVAQVYSTIKVESVYFDAHSVMID